MLNIPMLRVNIYWKALCFSKTGPLSSSFSIFIIEIPVDLSLFINDRCIGAAPLQLGKSDA